MLTVFQLILKVSLNSGGLHKKKLHIVTPPFNTNAYHYIFFSFHKWLYSMSYTHTTLNIKIQQTHTSKTLVLLVCFVMCIFWNSFFLFFFLYIFYLFLAFHFFLHYNRSFRCYSSIPIFISIRFCCCARSHSHFCEKNCVFHFEIITNIISVQRCTRSVGLCV